MINRAHHRHVPVTSVPDLAAQGTTTGHGSPESASEGPVASRTLHGREASSAPHGLLPQDALDESLDPAAPSAAEGAAEATPSHGGAVPDRSTPEATGSEGLLKGLAKELGVIRPDEG